MWGGVMKNTRPWRDMKGKTIVFVDEMEVETDGVVT
jgi:hypothetical protein